MDSARKLAILTGVVLVLSGCSNQDFGTVGGSLSSRTDHSAVLTANEVSKADELMRAQRLAKALGQWKNESGYSRDYHVGAGDTLEIGIMSLEEPGKPGKLLRTVGSDGAIDMQWVGQIAVSGLTVGEIRTRVTLELAGRYIKDPQVTVGVSQYRAAPVLITGAVNKPGVYYLTSDRRTVLELLAEADGLSSGAGNELLLIRGSPGEVPQAPAAPQATVPNAGSTSNAQDLITINLRELVDEGDLRMNVWIRSGDMMTVLPRKQSYIYILGYVQRPGAFPISVDKDMGALQAVAMAGGLTPAARAQNSCLLRETPTGQKLIPVDLMKIARGQDTGVMLQPGDTLVVGSSLMGRLSEFVRPSVGVAANYSAVP